MLDEVRKRRSIRSYRNEPVGPAAIADLQEALLRSPSSRNLRPWRFVFVTDPEKLAVLSRAKTAHAGFLAEAPLGVVICGDEHASDCWIEDCSIAAALLQVTATSLGLGSCWIQIRGRSNVDGKPAEAHVAEALELPDDLRVLAVIAIGHPMEECEPRPAAGLPWDHIVGP